MGRGIMPYMTSIESLKRIWGSKIRLSKQDATKRMDEMLGFHFLAPQLATKWISQFNNEMKKEHGYPNYRSHVAMQDIFDGIISYPNAPWIYSYLLEGIIHEIAFNYHYKVTLDFKRRYPWRRTREDDGNPTDSLLNYLEKRTLIRSRFKRCILPNSEWVPCDLSILNYLPYSLPIPLPEPDESPYISTIMNKDLKSVYSKIDFGQSTDSSIEQMKNWFDRTKKEKRDLILFIY